MANILDYIAWRGDLTFKERGFTVPDALILSEFALYNLDGILGENNKVTMRQLREGMYKLHRENEQCGLLAPMDMKGLLDAAGQSERFKNVVMRNRINIYNEHKDMQITAMTADIPSVGTLVIFSGTGDTIIAWKEDFNLMYKLPTPSQEVAVKYLEAMAKTAKGKLYVSGHSKGGNLTIYSAVHSSLKVQKQLVKAISFDGPGLNEKDVDNLLKCACYDKIVNVIPEGSIVGRLFYHKEKTFIVKSQNAGLYQHDAFNWQLDKDNFLKAEGTNEDSDKIAELIKGIIEGMDEERREEFVEALYKLLFGSGAKTLLELSQKGKETLAFYKKLQPEEKKVILDIAGKLFAERTVRKLLTENIIDAIKGRQA